MLRKASRGRTGIRAMLRSWRSSCVGGRTSVLLIGALALSGCSLVPEAQPLATTLPDEFSVSGSADTSALNQPWWSRFHDQGLSSLIASGLRDSPTISASRARLNAAEHEARAAGLSLDGSANASVSSSTPGSRSHFFGIGLNLLPLGRRAADLSLAEARLEQERQQFRDVERIFLESVVVDYIQLRYFEALRGARQEQLRLARQSLQFANERAAQSATTEFDLLDARAFVAEIEATIPLIESEIVARQRDLAATLGLSPDHPLDLSLRPGPQPIPTGISDIGVPANLLRTRPDVRQAEHAYEAALARVGIARANRYPQLSLEGIVRAVNPGQSVRTATLGISVPVFSQPALAAQEAAAAARVEEGFHNWHGAVISAVHDVERSLSGIARTSESLAAARRAERVLAERASLIRDARAMSGQITSQDLIEANRDLMRSREQVIETARDLAIQYVELWTALGRPDVHHRIEDSR